MLIQLSPDFKDILLFLIFLLKLHKNKKYAPVYVSVFYLLRYTVSIQFYQLFRCHVRRPPFIPRRHCLLLRLDRFHQRRHQSQGRLFPSDTAEHVALQLLLVGQLQVRWPGTDTIKLFCHSYVDNGKILIPLLRPLSSIHTRADCAA